MTEKNRRKARISWLKTSFGRRFRFEINKRKKIVFFFCFLKLKFIIIDNNNNNYASNFIKTANWFSID